MKYKFDIIIIIIYVAAGYSRDKNVASVVNFRNTLS